MSRDLGPLAPFLERQGYLVLDGGLATELEERGYDLAHHLWSARLLDEDPQAIRRLHFDYLEAGADCVISASYQATIQGFTAHGFSRFEARALLLKSVALALEAREAFWAVESNRRGRLRPLVAASIGPYGAYLADGSEYTGAYRLSAQSLRAFHEERFHLLAHSDADLLACETIPSAPEARVLARLVAEQPGVYAWFSFSCRDGIHISDGTPLAAIVEEIAPTPGLVAVGVNCTAPQFVPALLESARTVTDLPLVAYPNSGEWYDARRHAWHGHAADFGAGCVQWHVTGARLVGGCCRTHPSTIEYMRRELTGRE